MRRHLLVIGALSLLLCVPQAGFAGGAGTHLASFLEMDVGARQIGLGGAFTGLADDALTVFYNPAGLRLMEASEIHIETSTWPGDISYQHVSYGFHHSVLPGTFAFSWAVMQMSPYAEKTEYYNPDSEFGIGTGEKVDAGDMAFGGSYCWDFGDGLSVGGTVRWYHLGMAEAFCEGLTGDLGVLYETRIRNLRVGASVMNLGPANHWSRTGSESGFGDDFPMPTTYRAGASMRVFDVVTHRVTVAGDYKRTPDGADRMSVGTEYTFNRDSLFLFGRAGYRFNYDEEGLTLGAGLLFPTSEASVRVDYAYADMGNLDHIDRFSVTFIF